MGVYFVDDRTYQRKKGDQQLIERSELGGMEIMTPNPGSVLSMVLDSHLVQSPLARFCPPSVRGFVAAGVAYLPRPDTWVSVTFKHPDNRWDPMLDEEIEASLRCYESLSVCRKTLGSKGEIPETNGGVRSGNCHVKNDWAVVVEGPGGTHMGRALVALLDTTWVVMNADC